MKASRAFLNLTKKKMEFKEKSQGTKKLHVSKRNSRLRI